MTARYLVQQALRLTDVYESKGEDFLSTYRLPLLTWKESQDLKSAHQAALEAAPGECIMHSWNPIIHITHYATLRALLGRKIVGQEPSLFL